MWYWRGIKTIKINYDILDLEIARNCWIVSQLVYLFRLDKSYSPFPFIRCCLMGEGDINGTQSRVQKVIFSRLPMNSLHVLRLLGLWIFATRWIPFQKFRFKWIQCLRDHKIQLSVVTRVLFQIQNKSCIVNI